jgi:hypothetical protein
VDKVVGWVIFYDNTNSVTNKDCKPEDVPPDGVQWIVEYMESGGKRFVHGMDYYHWTGDSWAGGNLSDLEKWIRLLLPQIKFGRWTSDSNYQKVLDLATGKHGNRFSAD